MTKNEVKQILDHISYKDWNIEVQEDGQRLYMQVDFLAEDVDTGFPVRQKGRKWMLSPHMTRSEIVSTAFKAVLTAEEHEVRENFLYRMEPVFGPHFDVEELAELSRVGKVDVRKAM